MPAINLVRYLSFVFRGCCLYTLNKKLFSSFVERVDVFEDYVTIVLKVFDMINVRVCNGSGAIKEEPPLDFHQMVVWNGGAEGNRLHLRQSRKLGFRSVEPSRATLVRVALNCSIPNQLTNNKSHPCGWLLLLVEPRGA